MSGGHRRTRLNAEEQQPVQPWRGAARPALNPRLPLDMKHPVVRIVCSSTDCPGCGWQMISHVWCAGDAAAVARQAGGCRACRGRPIQVPARCAACTLFCDILRLAGGLEMAHTLCCVVDLQGHFHGPGCGHASFEHDGHVDYLVSGLRRAAEALPSSPPPYPPPPTHSNLPPPVRLPRQVGDELHHVRDSCCVNDCHGGPVVVSHGRLSTLLHRCGDWREVGSALPPYFRSGGQGRFEPDQHCEWNSIRLAVFAAGGEAPSTQTSPWPRRCCAQRQRRQQQTAAGAVPLPAWKWSALPLAAQESRSRAQHASMRPASAVRWRCPSCTACWMGCRAWSRCGRYGDWLSGLSPALRAVV